MFRVTGIWKIGKNREKKCKPLQALLMVVILKLRIVFGLIINRFQNCVVYRDVNISHLVLIANLVLGSTVGECLLLRNS